MRTGSQLRHALVATLLVAAAATTSFALPYDEAADARADIRRTLASARAAGLPVLVVFGANWCADCRMLDAAFNEGSSAALIREHFRVVKVDVGKFDRNVDVADGYGVPLRKGIPAVAVLSDSGAVLYATKAGELADARGMGERGVFEFFRAIAAGRNATRR